MIEALLHFLACYFITDVTYNFLSPSIGGNEYWQTLIPRLLAMGIAGLVAVGKELWDKYHDKEFISAWDMAWNAAGILGWIFVQLVAELMPWVPNTFPPLP
jgi:hypothetical protein